MWSRFLSTESLIKCVFPLIKVLVFLLWERRDVQKEICFTHSLFKEYFSRQRQDSKWKSFLFWVFCSSVHNFFHHLIESINLRNFSLRSHTLHKLIIEKNILYYSHKNLLVCWGTASALDLCCALDYYSVE